jgi:hypothetical protein
LDSRVYLVLELLLRPQERRLVRRASRLGMKLI